MTVTERETQVEKYLDALFERDDIIEIRLLPKRVQLWGTRADVMGWCGRLHASNCDVLPQNIYAGTNPRPRHLDASHQTLSHTGPP